MMSNNIQDSGFAFTALIQHMCERDERITKELKSTGKSITDSIANATEADIKARDRVNISLVEYKSLIHRIKELEWENRVCRTMLDKIKIPYTENIDPDSVEVLYTDLIGNPLDFTRKIRYRIEFDIIKERY